MQNAIPAGLFEGDPDEVIKRLSALLDASKTQEQKLLLLGVKLGYQAAQFSARAPAP